MQKLHPTPALGGEPKEAAVSWIRTHEPQPAEGCTGGPIGWLGIQEDDWRVCCGDPLRIL